MRAFTTFDATHSVGIYDGPWHRIRYQSPALSAEIGGDFRGCPAAEVLIDPSLGPLLKVMGHVYDTQTPARLRLADGATVRVLPRMADRRLLGVATRWRARDHAEARSTPGKAAAVR